MSGERPGARRPVAGESLEVPRSPRTVVYVADPGRRGRWRYVSAQIEPLLGFGAEEWSGTTGIWAQRLHPDDCTRVSCGPPNEDHERPIGHVDEYRLRHRDGHFVWVRDDVTEVRAPDGALVWHGVLTDISGYKLLEAELERRVAQQAAVARLGEHALEGLSTQELMEEAITVVAELLGVEAAAVLELLAEEDAFVVRAGIGPGASPEYVARLRIPTGTGSQTGYTLLVGRPVVMSDWQTETRFRASPAAVAIGIRSALTVPIQCGDGPFGVLTVASQSPRAFSDRDVDFVQSLANVLADAVERRAIEEAVRYRALHDIVTGLPNRVLFEDRLTQALARVRRSGSLAAVLFLDLDRFKLINDSLGHHVGDQMLIDTGSRLREVLRASDTVARLGGDEFAVLLEDIGDEQEAIEVAERILAQFSAPFMLACVAHSVTTSIGIAMAKGGELAGDLLRDADAAMYKAKERGRARYEVFDAVMRGHALARLRAENDLRFALEREELWLAYQPIVELEDDRVVAVEALLRWSHPVRGTIPPSEFIPIAEETGLIEQLGEWVLSTACRQAAAWHRDRPQRPPIHVAVNLSGIQISRPQLPRIVEDVLGATGLDPSCLAVEITEGVMLRDTPAVSHALPALKRLGVVLALDDFGSGYSSLGYIVLMPLDALKIDRSFIDGLGTNPRDTALSEAIIAMAHALSLDVVAEGVQTELQLAELRRLRCDYAQGFLFSAPVRPEKIPAILDHDGSSRRPGGP